MFFSIIIPVYNRPDEINELLESLTNQSYKKDFEVVIIEDGSTETTQEIVEKYKDNLTISYYFKENSGPGDSRNYGMKNAKGDYFIIFDSDCIIPTNYIENVERQLQTLYVDFYGAPDEALRTFSAIQKAINFAMTSFLTTGGIRGGSEKIDTFQPRSFNMGISKKAFEASNGFGNIHPGEDPDLTIRLWKLGFKSRLFSTCFVYHKRRIDWEKFSTQVTKFGKARPILNSWHPEYNKLTYWFPSFFVLGFFMSIIALLMLEDIPLKIYFFYFVLIFIVSTITNKNILVGYYSIIAVWKQFWGYGLGFLQSFFMINVLKKSPQKAFPELFFKEQDQREVQVKQYVKEQKQENFQDQASQTELVEVQKIIKTKIIGLTGGIGSGKTTIANYMQSLGIPVYIADVEAKKVMELPTIINQIETVFEEKISENGFINREKLASIVFNDKEKLKKLNAIVHPEVKNYFNNWVERHKNFPILVKEAAILFESGSYKDCDAVISVIAPMDIRIKRVVERDNSSEEKVLQRIKNQISDEERISKSNFVIHNIDFEQAKLETNEIIKILKNT